mmetsp:Transcript_74194/g.176947  ORF Transcript_74194/g.176947 Transcript_74194/m.176947 type:complete len:217 (-) Transcript_74194:647-1297(-)
MDLRQIAEVERVVALCRGGQHCRRHVLVKLYRGSHHCVRHTGHSPRKSAQEPLHDGLENPLKALLLERSNEDEVEVPLKPASQERPSSTRRAHCTDENQVHQVSELCGLSLIPALSVHPLAEQLNRWLSTILLLGRHVQIIDEQQALLAKRRSIGALLSLVKLAINDVLRLVRVGLGTERKRDHCVLVFVKPLQQLLLNHHSFAGTRQAGVQDVIF